MKTVFLRVLEDDDKASALLEAIRDRDSANRRRRFEVDPQTFATMPSSPFAYWMGPSLTAVFRQSEWRSGIPREARNGLGTLDDFRFVRLSFEVLPTSSDSPIWRPFSKGGRHAPFYQDVVACVRWGEYGKEIKAYIEHFYAGGHWSRSIRSVDYYFRPGITWPLRGVRFSAQAVPQGGIFSPGGKMLFASDDDLLLLLAFMNSEAFDLLIRVFAGKVGGVQYQSGLIEQIPIATAGTATRRRLENLARQGFERSRALDTCNETSHAFTSPALLQVDGVNMRTRISLWTQRARAVRAEIAAIHTEINELCFALYAIEKADRDVIEANPSGDDERLPEDSRDEDVTDLAATEVEENATAQSLVVDLVAWAVGVAFGRFDVRGALDAEEMAAPFAPLRVCSPGMLTGRNGLPLPMPANDYPISFPESGILVSDTGHSSDLTASVRSVFGEVFGSRADQWWSEVGELLDAETQDIAAWLSKRFFEHHIERYSKSHRKAPLFWQLGTASGRYSVWLYAHRTTRDTLFQLHNEVVARKLAHEERSLAALAAGAENSHDRNALAAQESFVDELRAMSDELKRVAPLWNPNLDDGVIINFAPLWRLVPQNRSWQKELKATWDALCEGKYDWARLAMHLWPERVVTKCATDRSLAIAHGLEEVFWIEGSDGKWTARKTPTKAVGEQVKEHTSPAVKSALKSLLDAPVAAGKTAARGRGGSRRKGSAALEEDV